MPPPGRPRCVAPYRPEKGDEDIEKVLAKQGKVYVVGNGRTMGIFTAEARARKQVEGVSNGHWRKAKSASEALSIWAQECDAFHDAGCPTHDDLDMARIRPAPRRDVATNSQNARLVLQTGESPARYTTTKMSEAEAFSMLGFSSSSASTAPRSVPATSRSALSPSPATPISPSAARSSRFTTSPVKTSTHPPSPLSTMDAVDAFSRMGLSEPVVHTAPVKQWVVVGVNIFFAQRTDALDYILTHRLPAPCGLLGSRNIRKLRCFARGEKYVPGPLDGEYSDDE
ncbi:hypothetical protein C8F04DRAFT_1252774 [Mycena alexandri]|uniref:Ribonuclease H1 N-terminal domain-containing protein n=1 Tax=Mycena alexandri TaxID=1745969 RepID=A0AAD6TA45_9AGAR|nr:hypothetical protein C8F04DRAFT_1252774 [Mycena alexandri]